MFRFARSFREGLIQALFRLSRQMNTEKTGKPSRPTRLTTKTTAKTSAQALFSPTRTHPMFSKWRNLSARSITALFSIRPRSRTRLRTRFTRGICREWRTLTARFICSAAKSSVITPLRSAASARTRFSAVIRGITKKTCFTMTASRGRQAFPNAVC